MRKIFWFLIAAILFVACETPKETKVNRESVKKELQLGKLSYDKAYQMMFIYNIREGKFTSEEGHRFKIFTTARYGVSTPHDPDCPKCIALYD